MTAIWFLKQMMSKLDNVHLRMKYVQKEKKNELLPEIFSTYLKNITFLFLFNFLDVRAMFRYKDMIDSIDI